jgi:translation initiation factor 2 subunit 1
VKIRADFELTCFTYEGIDAIRDSLLEAKKVVSDDQLPIAFKMIAPPHYKCECITLEKAKGIAKLSEAL